MVRFIWAAMGDDDDVDSEDRERIVHLVPVRILTSLCAVLYSNLYLVRCNKCATSHLFYTGLLFYRFNLRTVLLYIRAMLWCCTDATSEDPAPLPRAVPVLLRNKALKQLARRPKSSTCEDEFTTLEKLGLVYQLKEGAIDFVSASKIYHLDLYQVLRWVSNRTRIEDEHWYELYGWLYPNKQRWIRRRTFQKR